MNHYLHLIPVLLTVVAAFSCEDTDGEEKKEKERRALQQYLDENNITVPPTETGLYYIGQKEGNGLNPVATDYVEVMYTGFLLDGTVFASTFDSVAMEEDFYDPDVLYGPIRFQLSHTLEGLQEGISMMKEGGEARLILPYDIGLGGIPAGVIPAYSTLVYDMELLHVIKDPDAYETRLIQDYFDRNSIDRVASVDSLYYFEEITGEGPLVAYGDVLSVYYRGYLLDGREFAGNYGEEEYVFHYPGEYFIDGWNEGLALMRQGSKGTLLIPYKKGYGAEGLKDQYNRTKVGPYTTVLFDIEIMDIR